MCCKNFRLFFEKQLRYEGGGELTPLPQTLPVIGLSCTHLSKLHLSI